MKVGASWSFNLGPNAIQSFHPNVIASFPLKGQQEGGGAYTVRTRLLLTLWRVLYYVSKSFLNRMHQQSRRVELGTRLLVASSDTYTHPSPDTFTPTAGSLPSRLVVFAPALLVVATLCFGIADSLRRVQAKTTYISLNPTIPITQRLSACRPILRPISHT